VRLRGTVYAVTEHDDTTEVARAVREYDVENADDFKRAALGELPTGTSRAVSAAGSSSVTVEFGPITPPWRRLS
jgi:hypothetical protein